IIAGQLGSFRCRKRRRIEDEGRRRGRVQTSEFALSYWEKRERASAPIAQECVRRNSKEKCRRHTSPDARERIPTGASEVARSYHFNGACAFRRPLDGLTQVLTRSPEPHRWS